MAKKKRVKQAKVKKSDSLKNKISLVVNKLLFFSIVGIICLVFYAFVPNLLLKNLFFVFAMASGFIAVGFLIALLILFVIKFSKRK
jgi:uncharacterized membrane protein